MSQYRKRYDKYEHNTVNIVIFIILFIVLSISLIIVSYSLFLNSNNSQDEGNINNNLIQENKVNEIQTPLGQENSNTNLDSSNQKSTEENKVNQSDTENKELQEKPVSSQLESLYSKDDYINGVVDPQKVDTTPALNQDSDLILVNKKYVLDENYAPEVFEVEGMKLRSYVIDAYEKMKDDASNTGVNLKIGSAYRSYDTQISVFNSYLAQDSYENVITYSAYPGTSEHQTGLVIDFVEGGSCDYTECFEQTQSGIWLRENAYKYGFILRFPKGKENITGYMYEPWHYRYVGKDNAQIIYENNLTLEEYVLS